MIKPIALASGAVIISGVAVANGWPHTVTAVVLLAVGIRLAQVRTGTQRVREATGKVAHTSVAARVAELLVVLAAARSGSPAAKDLALEALSLLDEITLDGASSRAVLIEGLRFAMRLGGQERIRGRSQVLHPKATLGETGSRERMRLWWLIRMSYGVSAIMVMGAFGSGVSRMITYVGAGTLVILDVLVSRVIRRADRSVSTDDSDQF